ncbi:RluA family pseudouridine synthase [Bacillus sp. FJAT-45066]|uniref:RluA family pseudouridine synthase n=1 Tax=Bacillus sp. FJAT-45066 TaxID=2011010 RepID=UPI000BB82455|nr:RluA family pseudouridine synthase [Bacillus sp. FJAT-45066]
MKFLKNYQLTFQATTDDDGMILREYLRKQHISKAALTDIKFGGGAIRVNSEEVTVRYRLEKDDIVQVLFPEELPSEEMVAEDIQLTILYEDEEVLLINKPSHMNSIPSREHPTGSVANALLHYYKKNGIPATVHIVTRLDRDTSGVMLIAKNRFVHHLFSLQQTQHEINRSYFAIAHRLTQGDAGTIDAPIGRKPDSIIEREVRSDGQLAVTHYEVISKSRDYTVLRLQLETGRTHQIRVHLAFLGHPLVGDDLYGGKRDIINRQALHSEKITFFHPILKKEMTFMADLPEDMKELIKQLGGHY